jgi:protein tyrosine/serine phosphatase
VFDIDSHIAGKDRTGVLAAIFLALAGAPTEVIAYDYALSRIGIEPGREMLTQMLMSFNKEWSADTPGMYEFSQIKAEFMEGMLQMMEEKYGGVDGYVRGLGFEDEELREIREVLKGRKE